MNVAKLSEEALINIVEDIANPSTSGLASTQVNTLMLTFCLNCPDPVRAMDLILEAPQGMSSKQIVEEALAMPTRSVESWSPIELALTHPLRHWTVAT